MNFKFFFPTCYYKKNKQDPNTGSKAVKGGAGSRKKKKIGSYSDRIRNARP